MTREVVKRITLTNVVSDKSHESFLLNDITRVSTVFAVLPCYFKRHERIHNRPPLHPWHRLLPRPSPQNYLTQPPTQVALNVRFTYKKHQCLLR